MIPKIIHYIWLGGNPLPEMVEKCIKSWEKFCPDWEIKRWDESNLNIDCCKYSRQAYDAKKFAFSSDAIRFQLLRDYGGVYLDIDVELLKPIDDLLNQKCFMGYEIYNKNLSVAPGLILGSEKDGFVVSELWNLYEQDSFYKKNGDINFETVCEKTMKFLYEKYAMQFDGKTVYFDDITIYAPDYFCPLNGGTKKLNITENSYSKHLYLASWAPKLGFFRRLRNGFFDIIRKIIGEKNYKKIRNKIKR